MWQLISIVTHRPATVGFKHSEAFVSASILLLHSSLCTPFHLSLTQPLELKTRRARQLCWLSLSNNKRREILRKDIARLARQTRYSAATSGWSLCPFVSSSLFFSFTRFSTCCFLWLTGGRGGKRRKWVRQTVKKRWMRRMDGGWREGEGLPVSRQGFNEEPLKFTMTEQHPCPLQKPPTSLRRHAVVSSHFTSSTSSSWFPSFCLSLSYNCLLSLLLPPSPISPLVLLCDQAMDHVST